MPAYIVADIVVHDLEAFEEYKKQAAATCLAYGGRYLVRGGRLEALEGSWAPKRFVVIEFPSVERAKDWWNSQEYSGPKAIRQAAAGSSFIVVEGV